MKQFIISEAQLRQVIGYIEGSPTGAVPVHDVLQLAQMLRTLPGAKLVEGQQGVNTPDESSQALANAQAPPKHANGGYRSDAG